MSGKSGTLNPRARGANEKLPSLPPFRSFFHIKEPVHSLLERKTLPEDDVVKEMSWFLILFKILLSLRFSMYFSPIPW